MLSKIKACFKTYRQLTVLQKQAIDDQDLALLSQFTEEKNLVINTMKKMLCSNQRELNDEIKNEGLAIIEIEKSNINKLNQLKKNICVDINNIKDRQNAFNSYAKTIKSLQKSR